MSKFDNSLIHELFKFIAFLSVTLILYNSFSFILTYFFINKPNIVKFRLLCTISQFLTLFLLYFILRPTFSDIGFHFNRYSHQYKIFITVSSIVLCSLIPLSFFVMSAKPIFALVTNFHFGLTTPLFEELIFRGYWWERLNKKNNNEYKTLVLTSLFFGIFHFGYYFLIAYTAYLHNVNTSFLSIMITKYITATTLGLILGLARLKSKDVSLPIIIHGIINIIGN